MRKSSELRVTRRRFIRISAAAPGLALMPVPGRGGVGAAEHLHVWRGVALGADAMLQLHHPDPRAASRLTDMCLKEVARLEKIFSLYRDDSAIVHLNRKGRHDGPPIELVELLGQAAQFSRLTGGAFDVTVQPLWDLYAAHFTTSGADPAGPAAGSISAVLKRVGYNGVSLDSAGIRFMRPGMAITLNGIAQGYITDRIVDLLRGEGIDQSLVDMGEIRAIGSRPSGEPWMVGLEDPGRQGQAKWRVPVVNRAVSTSGGYGTPLDPAGRFNHIFNPATGGTSWRYRSVSVVAPNATTADALSTAFSLMPLDATRPIIVALGLQAYFALPDRSWQLQGA